VKLLELCKHFHYSEVLLAGASGFLPLLLEGFSALNSCVSCVGLIYLLSFCMYIDKIDGFPSFLYRGYGTQVQKLYGAAACTLKNDI
jgi:hypothetical protein